MSERVMHRVPTEGADPLLLAGVNDANFLALERETGVRTAFRGEEVTIAGEIAVVEDATRVVKTMVDIVRAGRSLSPDDVERLIVNGHDGDAGAGDDLRIILPGIRRSIRPKTAGQAQYLTAMRDFELVIGIGPAGTGKTYLAVAAAVDALQRKRVKRLILARPAVEAGERLGFLPGDMQAKVDPYLRPLYDALDDMMPPDRVQKALETGIVEIAPLAYMRGRTLADAFVILDEAQNVTSGQMKMFLTRLGVNSRAVVIGDKTQVDLSDREESGLHQVERILPGVDGVAFCYLDDGDVVRHKLVREIIRAYDDDERGDQPSE